MLAKTGLVVCVVWCVRGASARVAGKAGGYSNTHSGKSTSGINEEIIWISISMAVGIAALLAAAAAYLLRRRCHA